MGSERPERRLASSRREHELVKTLDSDMATLLFWAIQSGRPPGVNRSQRADFGIRRVFVWRGRTVPGLYPPDAIEHRRTRELPDVEAHITGTVWKIEVAVGDKVEEGDPVVILESMKMEMPVEAEDPGVVSEILCSEGQSVSEGDTLVVLE
jgi:acetyl-CoA carboxylase biotin carboxyl carrier protein